MWDGRGEHVSLTVVREQERSAVYQRSLIHLGIVQQALNARPDFSEGERRGLLERLRSMSQQLNGTEEHRLGAVPKGDGSGM